MLNALRLPYPLYEKSSGKWFTAFGSGLFVFLFLLIFKPFGLQHLPIETAPMIMAGYGFVTFITVAIHAFAGPAFFPFFYREDKWNTLKAASDILITVQLVALGNAFYSSYILGRELSLAMLMQFELPTFAVAVFPVAAIVMLRQMRLMRRNLREAESITARLHFKKRLGTSQGKTVIIPSENSRENFSVLLSELMFICSADNYIEVHYLDNGKENRKLLRGTLRATRDVLRPYTAFYRCHRSFIVNLDFVESVTGNSQGLKLVLKDSSQQVPVSRNLNKEIEQRLSR